MKKLSPRMKIVLSMLIFGTIGVFRRWIPYPSSVVALARSVIGLLFLLLVRALRHEPVDRAAVKWNLPKLLLLGAMLGTNWIFLFEAYNHTSVAAATMCYYMAPVFIILLSSVVFGEKITPRKGICAAVAVFGMVLVSDVLTSGLRGTKGLLLGLIAAALYAAIVIVNRTLKDISAEDRTIMQFAAAAAVMLRRLRTEARDQHGLLAVFQHGLRDAEDVFLCLARAVDHLRHALADAAVEVHLRVIADFLNGLHFQPERRVLGAERPGRDLTQQRRHFCFVHGRTSR